MRLISLVLAFSSWAYAQQFETVLTGGRIMDPESGLDAPRDIGINAGKIAAISTHPLRGLRTIKVTGLVVAPGFIDLHSHGQTDENYRFKARDGVTTALELEVGVNPVAPWYQARQGKALVNFGASSGHIPARMAVLRDSGTFLPRDRAVTQHASALEERRTLEAVQLGLDDGALGIGLGIAYMPAVTREEILSLFHLAAARKKTCFVHMRNAGPVEPSVVDALQEVLADTAATGAGLHIVHLPSMALRQTELCMGIIRGARAHGLDVTVEAYPYTAGMTNLETAIFDPGWRARLGIDYPDLQWVATGERLTESTFASHRKEGGAVIIHSIPEDVVRAMMADPLVIIASDGWITDGKGHPRGAGTYARVLGRYVREQHALSLMDAIRKMSLLPAQRLESVSPQLSRKGRIRVGADADLTVFDPVTVIDRATYENPALYSTGIRYVFVNGQPVVANEKLVEGTYPGLGIKTR